MGAREALGVGGCYSYQSDQRTTGYACEWKQRSSSIGFRSSDELGLGI